MLLVHGTSVHWAAGDPKVCYTQEVLLHVGHRCCRFRSLSSLFRIHWHPSIGTLGLSAAFDRSPSPVSFVFVFFSLPRG